MVFDRSLVTSVQPKSLLIQMREVVADCDDGSSDGSLMLLSPPHDIPEVTFPAESSGDQETRDEVSPVVISRRVTPPPATSRGRPTRGLQTTTCAISTGGARPLHRKLQPFIGARPASDGPVVATYSS